MIVLASKSASRRAMLEAAGVAFEAIPASIDERAIEAALIGEPPQEVARVLAREKALALATDAEPRWVLGSDSLVVVGGKRFDKPRDRDEAADHLRFFSGKEMHLHSAAALARNGHVKMDCGDQAVLFVRSISDAFIDAYLDAEWPEVAACVGVFRIEGRGVQLFESIEGDHFTVLGMPLFRVLWGLRQFTGFPE
ncbi:Maf family protein [Tsuneonella sp. HG094]